VALLTYPLIVYSRYCSDLNVNSAIAKPDHDEILRVPADDGDDQGSAYVLKGYAYAGGGRLVTRVEISLDGGESWKLAKQCVTSRVSLDHGTKNTFSGRTFPEDLYRLARYEDELYGTIDLTESDTYL
jgi:nitrate reductase (NAD(P)H)